MTQKQFMMGLIKDELERGKVLLQNDSEEKEQEYGPEM